MLSIIIPTLNEEKCLPRLLRDLSRQIYRDFEVIVVDGGSSDKTVKLARSFSPSLPRLTVTFSPRPHVCHQRNLGVKTAKGKILMFMDADSRLDPEFLLGARYRWETSQAEVLSFWFKPDIINTRNESIALAVNLFRELQNNLNPRYLLEALFMIKKDRFLAAGGFDESINYAEGSQLIRTLVKQGNVSKIVRDPVFTFSFRRLRRMGLLTMAGTMARLELSNLIGKNYQSFVAKKIYPMIGGSQFRYNQKAKNQFVIKIKKLLMDLDRDF